MAEEKKKKAPKAKAPPPPPPPDPSTYSPEQKAAIEATNKSWQDKLKSKDAAKQKELDVDREEIEALAKRICGNAKFVKDGVIFPCGVKKTGIYCVPTHPSYPGGKSPLRTSKESVDKINKASGTKIDWNKIEAEEGGKHLYAYVPWMVKFSTTKIGKPAGGGGALGDVYTPNAALGNDGRVKGMSNSGVTVGSGVDLGAIDSGEKGAKTLRDAGISEPLIEKLKPYLGKKKAEACKALREKPLTLTEEEANQMNEFAMKKHSAEAKKFYEDGVKQHNKKNPDNAMKSWDELSGGEQTVLASRQYHNGNIIYGGKNGDLVRGIGTGDHDAIRSAYAKHPDGPSYRPRFNAEMGWMGIDPNPPKKKEGK